MVALVDVLAGLGLPLIVALTDLIHVELYTVALAIRSLLEKTSIKARTARTNNFV